MSYILVLPNGQIVSGIDDSYTRDEALAVLRKKMPEAFASEVAETPAPVRKIGGFGGALSKGTESAWENFRTTGEALFGDKKQAALGTLERSKAIDAKYEEAYDEAKIKDAYDKGGFMAAAKEVIRQFPNVVAENIPNMVAMAVGGKAGALAGGAAGMAVAGPAGAAIGATLGGLGGAWAGSSGLQFGSNIQRQAQQQQQRGEEINPDIEKAATSAFAQGALDVASFKFLTGKTLGRIFGVASKEGTAAAEKALVEAAQKSLAATAERGLAATVGRGVATGVAAEVPTEVAQQVLERWQAGLPLLDKDAIDEYRQTAIQTAMVGGALGPVGSVTDRAAARNQLVEDAQKKAAEDAKAAKEAEAAKRATPEWQNSVEGLTERRKELGRQAKELRQQIGAIKLDKEAPDPADAARKEELSAQHKTLLGEIKDLSKQLVEAQKSPEQRFIDMVTATPAEPETAPPAAPAEAPVLDPRWEADTRKKMAEQGIKPKKIDEYIDNVRNMQQRGKPAVKAEGPQFSYPESDLTDTLLMSITHPNEYRMWQEQADRERAAGQIPRFGEAGMLPSPVEEMAPVIGPSGMVTGYEPVVRQQARPPFELGQQIPEMQQQDLGLPEPAAVPPAPVLPKEQPRVQTSFASAAPMPPAGIRDQNTWRVAVPGQDVSPRPAEVIPPDAALQPSPEAAPAQGELALPSTADVLLDSALKRKFGDSFEGSLRPSALKSEFQRRSLVKALRERQANIWNDIQETIDRLRNLKGEASTGPNTLIDVDTQRANLLQKLDQLRQEYTQHALQESIENRALNKERQMTREEALQIAAVDAAIRDAVAQTTKGGPPGMYPFLRLQNRLDRLDRARTQVLKRLETVDQGNKKAIQGIRRALDSIAKRRADVVAKIEELRAQELERRPRSDIEKVLKEAAKQVQHAKDRMSMPSKKGLRMRVKSEFELRGEKAPPSPRFGPLPAPAIVQEATEQTPYQTLVTDEEGRVTGTRQVALTPQAQRAIGAAPEATGFADAALEAEVTGRQPSLFPTKVLPSRGFGATTAKGFNHLAAMMRGRWLKQRNALIDAIEAVKNAVAVQAQERTNLSTLRSTLNQARTSLDRINKLLENKRYSPEIRARIDALIQERDNALEAQRTAQEVARNAREQDVLVQNAGTAFAAEGVPAMPPEYAGRPSKRTKQLQQAEKNAALALKQAELTLKAWEPLIAEIGRLDALHDEALTAFRSALSNVESAKVEEHVAKFHVTRLENQLRENFRQQLEKTITAVEKSGQQVKEERSRFDLPTNLPRTVHTAPVYGPPKISSAKQIEVYEGDIPTHDKWKLRQAGTTVRPEETPSLNWKARKKPQATSEQGGLFSELSKEVQAEVAKEKPVTVKNPGTDKLSRDIVQMAREGEPKWKRNRPSQADRYNDAVSRRAQERAQNEGDFELRVGETTETGITPQQASDTVDTFLSKNPGLPLINVANPTQLPAGVVTLLQQRGQNPDTVKGGMLPDGSLFVVRENHASEEDLQHTLAHEAIGHARAERVMYGTESGLQYMNRMADSYLATESATDELLSDSGFDQATADLIKKQAADAQQEQIKADMGRGASLEQAEKNGNVQRARMALREMVARLSEARPLGAQNILTKRFWKELYGQLRNWLRNKGLDLKLSDADVNYMVKQAYEGKILTTENSGPLQLRTGVKTPSELRDISRKSRPSPETRWDTVTKNGWGMVFRTQYVDRFDPFVRIAKQIVDSVRASQMMYYLRMTDRVNQMVSEVMTHGPMALVQAKDGKGWMYQSMKGANARDIVDTLRGEDINVWADYIALERAHAMKNGMYKLFGNAPPRISPEEQAKILEYGRNNPAFQKARDMYREFNAGIVKLLLDTGTITEAEAKDWTSRDYIPYFRKDDLGNIEMLGDHPIKIGNIRDQKDIAHLFGGDKKLDDPLENMARNARIMIGSAIRNQAAKNTAFELQKLGLGEFPKGRVRDEFGRNVIHFKEHGDDKSFVVNTGESEKFADIPGDVLSKSLEGVVTQIPTVLKLLQIPTKFLRDAVTLNPLYMMRQLTRDPVHAWLSTGMDTSALLNAYKRAINLMQHKDATGELLRERGLVGGQLIQGTDEDMSRIMSQIHAGQPVISKMISWLHDKGVAADATTRAALYDNFIKQGLSELEATMATMDSVNFATRGLSSSMQMANMLIPFFNAQIQGLDSVWRSLAGQMPFNERVQARQKLVQRAMMLAAATVAYYALVQDEDWYQNTPETVRMTNFLFKIPGVDEPIRIPRPFEFGLMFMAVPESILMASKGDPEADAAWKALRNQMINQMPGGSSFVLPAALKPAIETAANYSFFTGRPIVPSGMENLPSEDQWTTNTTKVARAAGNTEIAKALGISPMHVENIVKGYTAAIGYSTLQLIDAALADTSVPAPEKPLSRKAIVGPAFQQTDGAAIITRAYDAAAKFEAAKQRFNAAKTQGRVEDAKAIAEEMPREIALATSAAHFKDKMNKLTTLEKQVHFAPATTMSSEQKTEMLAKLRQAKIELSRQYENAWRQ